MSHPTDDELVDVALGDDPSDAPASTHVDACDTCTATVAELRRTLGLVASGLPSASWQAPPAHLWDRISDQLVNDDITDATDLTNLTGPPAGPVTKPATATTAADVTEPAARHTDLAPATTPAPVSPATSPATPSADDELGNRRVRDGEPRRSGRGRAVSWGAGLLAAASLAVGLLAGRAIWQPDPAPQPVAQVPLTTLDTKQDEGEASVVRTDEGLDLTVTTATPLDAGDGYLEVWLLNADGKRMVSVGVLAPGDQGSFPISKSLIDEGYVIVDISREQFDDSTAHSGDSLLRGKLPA
jgi:hypothetical protein